MFEISLLDLRTNKTFNKVFWNTNLKNSFVNKCRYSKKVKVVCIKDYTTMYD